MLVSVSVNIVHNGRSYPGYNKPVKTTKGRYKMRVLVKKGDKIKEVFFGHRGYKDFTQHKDPERRKNFRKRFAGILKRDGTQAIKDPFSPAYWAYRVLW